jgi:hypothetical protein
VATRYFLCKRLFIDSLVEKDLGKEISVHDTPISMGISFVKNLENTDEVRKRCFTGIVGSLLYAASLTRPDICYVVNLLSGYMEYPSDIHVDASLRIVKYLKRTCN